MRLQELVQELGTVVGHDVDITSIVYDSREAQPGSLFVAVPGFRFDGHDYAAAAVQRGAVALMVERLLPDLPVPQVVVEDARAALGLVGAAFYGHPSRKLRVIGVTGTNGKTTTTYMIRSILQRAGHTVGLIGTIETVVGNRSSASERTTPESLDLQRILAEMVEEGCDYAVMEVSSHALELKRTDGIAFRCGVFTNLTQDHLDFHKTPEDYFRSKAKLFKQVAGFGVVNFDDPKGLSMAAESKAPVVGYGVEREAQVRAGDVVVEAKGTAYSLHTPWGTARLKLPVTGQFNVYNSLAAAAVCLGEGISLAAVRDGLEALQGVPGRFELIDVGQPFAVIVDYAHTPDGLDNVLRTARAMTAGRVVVVFGAGGDRDRSKRPIMGEIAARLGDLVIITSDNPRSEDPEEICAEIAAGVRRATGSEDYVVEPDRRTAIRLAVASARPGDTVLIAGKGHEAYQEIQGVRTHFDDREEARKALKELYA
ncbi:MAG TPA: UDP-N-acetylmuramoyl-L-alanyl-D-glutamate--2,6-diaminopimelate ligase [Firmicutes bacterium]|nr:UDP-N-acetylmuramoyl-L-alanyl-D-glutamate--2,6-diaminopimelate ligase [Bacillota bacterium]